MSRLLDLCTGMATGYVVGWLAGSNVSRLSECHRLARRTEAAMFRDPTPEERARARLVEPIRRHGAAVRPVEPRSPLPASSEPLEPRNGAQEGTWPLDTAALHARPDYQEAMRRAEGMPWGDAVDLVDWLAERGIPTQRTDEPCTERSPGGGLVCCRKGEHASHLFEGSTARDRKDDADERIE